LSAVLAVPFSLRLLILFLLGTVAGAVVNWAIYGLCWNPRPLSPWSRSHPRDAASNWLDRLPLYGWWRSQRQGKQLGYEFWIRPLLVELLTGALFAGMYWWEVGELALVFPPQPGAPSEAFYAMLHWQCLSHVLLVSLMLAVSFIDLDEQTIPDEITVPGTLLGLAMAALVPAMRLPDLPPSGIMWNGLVTTSLQIASPSAWPEGLNGFPRLLPLVMGLACYGLWCLGLLPRVWHARHGWRRAIALLLARMKRERSSRFVLAVAIVGVLGITFTWRWGGHRWESLASSLVGMAVGGGLIWMVRIIGRWALNREAMGFGDVTLMCMIGAFLGWQPCLLIFFVAPFGAIVLGAIQMLVRRENVLPYGPFLCLGALAVILRWPSLWDRVWTAFAVGWLVPVTMGCCLVAMALLLTLLRLVRQAFSPRQ
jgi:leader peptidase (prepilin peptidase)/N-methyltransferase